MDQGGDDKFVASKVWLRNFFQRNGITPRHRTTTAQKVPATVIPKLTSYLMYLRSLRIKKGYQLSDIGAMGETPVWLDMPADTTMDFVGNKSIPIRTTIHEKSRITVLLAAKANGHKLPPFIVFKEKRCDKDLESLSGMECVYSDNGWMNEELTHIWL